MTTFIKVAKKPGSSQQTINVERNGEPFGQMWTWPNTATERHPWHALPLNGNHETFDTLKQAKTYMQSEVIKTKINGKCGKILIFKTNLTP